MIVVIEGLSAAGKSTWCRQNFPHTTVWESDIPPNPPSRNDQPTEAARFWIEKNAQRWSRAVELESKQGVGVCDTDPFKLHYVFCLWQIGAQAKSAWEFELDLHREMFREERLGLADRFFVSLPTAEVLRTQIENDSTRSRRTFDLHSRLGPALESWYQAVDSLESGRVSWKFPDSNVSTHLQQGSPRQERTGVEIFDRLIAALPVQSREA